jgi:hypothetical protein
MHRSSTGGYHEAKMIAVAATNTLEVLQSLLGLIDELGINNDYGVLTVPKMKAGP